MTITMKQLFNRDGDGEREIVSAVGLISNCVSFDKWEPLLPLGVREVEAIVGPEPVEALSRYYLEHGDLAGDGDTMADALRFLRQAVAMFTWLRVIPTLDAQHDGNGRSRRLGENERGLSALQEFKDEQNILRMAYEAVDALIEVMDRGAFTFWTGSRRWRQREGLLVRSKEEFDEFYRIGSHRLFVTLLPVMREVQSAEIAPVLGRHLGALLDGSAAAPVSALADRARRALVLLTMKKAVERLPVEVIPEGVVQVQQSQPVKSRLRAEQSARTAVAASLGDDARRILEALQAEVAAIEGGAAADDYITGPIVHSKGLSF